MKACTIISSVSLVRQQHLALYMSLSERNESMSTANVSLRQCSTSYLIRGYSTVNVSLRQCSTCLISEGIPQ